MKEQELTITRGTPADREAIQDTCIRSYSSYATVLDATNWAVMKAGLEDESNFIQLCNIATSFICRIDGQIAGVVFLVPSGHPTALFAADWHYIRMLGVLPEYRDRGIARLLMQACIDHAQATGAETVALHTAAYQGAWRIYERLGFQRLRDIGPIFEQVYWLYLLDLKTNKAVS